MAKKREVPAFRELIVLQVGQRSKCPIPEQSDDILN